MTADKAEHLATERPSDDYLAELSKHVRGIYYLIMIGAAAILLATAATPERSVEQALDQVDALVRLQDQWNERWLDELAETTIARGAQDYPNWPSGLPTAIRWQIELATGEAITVDAQRDGRDWSFRGAGGYTPPNQAPNLELPSLFAAPLRIDVFATVNDFRALWNSLLAAPNVSIFALPTNELVATLQSGIGRTASAGAVAVTATTLSSDEVRSPAMHISPPSPANRRLLNEQFRAPQLGRGSIHKALTLGPNDITHVWQVGINKAGGYADLSAPPAARRDAMLLEIPLHVFHVPLPAQKTLLEQIGRPLALGEFEFSFAELNQHSAGLGDLPIKQLRDYLSAKADDINDEVEVFGLKFQGSALGSWGLVFLALLQLYFAVTFRNFVNLRLQYYWLYPWLALYPDRLSKVLFVLSGFIFPTTIVLMLGFSHITGTLQWMLTGFVGAGVVVSLASLGWSLSLWHRLQAKP